MNEKERLGNVKKAIIGTLKERFDDSYSLLVNFAINQPKDFYIDARVNIPKEGIDLFYTLVNLLRIAEGITETTYVYQKDY